MSGLFPNYDRVRSLVIKEFIQIWRNPVLIFLLIILPLFQIFLYSYAVNLDVKNAPIAVIDYDKSPFSRDFLQSLHETNYFSFVKEAENEQEIEDLFKSNKIIFSVTIPSDFSNRLVRQQSPQILIEVDQSDPLNSGNATGAAIALRNIAFKTELTGPFLKLEKETAPFEVLIHPLFNPEGRTQPFIVPGLIGALLAMIITILAGSSIVSEKESGTMENLMMTPLTFAETILGKLVPNFIIGMVLTVSLLISTAYIFNIPVRGSYLLVLLLLSLYTVNTLIIGFLFSVMVKNQTTLVQINGAYMMPSMLLSGFSFPFYGMPEWAKLVGEALPLTHFLFAFKAILHKGSSFGHIYPDILYLCAFTMVTFYAAMKFNKRHLH